VQHPARDFLFREDTFGPFGPLLSSKQSGRARDECKPADSPFPPPLSELNLSFSGGLQRDLPAYLPSVRFHRLEVGVFFTTNSGSAFLYKIYIPEILFFQLAM